MKVKITLKDSQKECLDKVTSDLSLENHEKTIKLNIFLIMKSCEKKLMIKMLSFIILDNVI